jgi:hypothetical protein
VNKSGLGELPLSELRNQTHTSEAGNFEIDAFQDPKVLRRFSSMERFRKGHNGECFWCSFLQACQQKHTFDFHPHWIILGVPAIELFRAKKAFHVVITFSSAIEEASSRELRK